MSEREYNVRLPLGPDVRDLMVFQICKLRYPKWKWELNSEEAAKELWPSAPKEAVEALIEKRDEIRDQVAAEVGYYCSQLHRAVTALEDDK